MKLHIFQSNKGDCILLESSDGKRILCDGGMATSMRENVRAHLGKLRKNGHALDFVYVSHVDNDHIAGVLQLLEDELEWRVFDHHKQKTKEPKVPRPPKIGGIWHNAFRDQVPKKLQDIERLLAAAAPVLFGTGVPELREVGDAMSNIATGVPEALEVSKLADRKLLGIPTNKLPGVGGRPKLLMVRPNQKTIPVGSMNLTIVGPTADELRNLRTGWHNWIRDHETEVQKIRAEMKTRLDALTNGAAAGSPFDLGDWNGIPDFKGVTIPNVASLVFMVEENGKRLLLTGDAQQDILVKGLEKTKFLRSGVPPPRRAEGSAPWVREERRRGVLPKGIGRPLCVLRERPAREPGPRRTSHRVRFTPGGRRQARARPGRGQPELPLLVQHALGEPRGRHGAHPLRESREACGRSDGAVERTPEGALQPRGRARAERLATRIRPATGEPRPASAIGRARRGGWTAPRVESYPAPARSWLACWLDDGERDRSLRALRLPGLRRRRARRRAGRPLAALLRRALPRRRAGRAAHRGSTHRWVGPDARGPLHRAAGFRR